MLHIVNFDRFYNTMLWNVYVGLHADIKSYITNINDLPSFVTLSAGISFFLKTVPHLNTSDDR